VCLRHIAGKGHNGMIKTPNGIPFKPVPPEVEIVGEKVLDAAFKIHTALGPGLLESVYEACLAYEIRKRGLKVETQIALPVIYEGVHVDAGLRMDMLVEKCVIVELKSVDTINPVFEAQLLTYLKLANIRLGYLINFNVTHLRDGFKRMVS
jgi:GxxExxY protein